MELSLPTYASGCSEASLRIDEVGMHKVDERMNDFVRPSVFYDWPSLASVDSSSVHLLAHFAMIPYTAKRAAGALQVCKYSGEYDQA